MSILKNKSYKRYDRMSRYATTPYYYNNRFDKYNFGTWSYLDDTTAYELYLVQPQDTYDKIALKYYNRPDYFWVICNFNRIENCFDDPMAGTYLKIPVVSELIFED